MGYSIAIDGPAGAGKSTVAKLVAKEKGICLCGHGSHVQRACSAFLTGRDSAGRDR